MSHIPTNIFDVIDEDGSRKDKFKVCMCIVSPIIPWSVSTTGSPRPSFTHPVVLADEQS